MNHTLVPQKVSELNGFAANQRVTGQDVQSSPPQLYSGRILSVWGDETACVQWDFELNHEAERHLVSSGRVELHNLSRTPS